MVTEAGPRKERGEPKEGDEAAAVVEKAMPEQAAATAAAKSKGFGFVH